MTELREKTNSLKCCDIDPDPVRSEEAAVEKDDAQKANKATDKGTGEDSPENEMRYFNPPLTKVQKILTQYFHLSLYRPSYNTYRQREKRSANRENKPLLTNCLFL